MKYTHGAELPSVGIEWTDSSGGILDFSLGWTFTVKIGQPNADADVTKTSGITGDAALPNIVIAWDPGELDDLDTGAYVLQVAARHTASGKDRFMQTPFVVESAVT